MSFLVNNKFSQNNGNSNNINFSNFNNFKNIDDFDLGKSDKKNSIISFEKKKNEKKKNEKKKNEKKKIDKEKIDKEKEEEIGNFSDSKNSKNYDQGLKNLLKQIKKFG